MNDENATRLKEDFRFVVQGARCRTATYLNPNLAALGQCEWMEAECTNGYGWDIKIMKASTAGSAEGDLMVDQNYLPHFRGISFGAAVLKLVEYQKAQEALGFLADPEDRGAQAGAEHFYKLAQQAGIVFNADHEPVAPFMGIVTQPGRYPASALKSAYDAARSNERKAIAPAPVRAFASISTSATPYFPHPPVVGQKRKAHVTATLLNEIVNSLSEHGGHNVLRKSGFNPFRPGYFYFSRTFDNNFSRVRQLYNGNQPREDILEELNGFEYHAFRIAGAWAKRALSKNFYAGSYDRSVNIVENAVSRCEAAARQIGVRPDFDFEAARFPGPIGGFVETRPLSEIIRKIEILSSGAAPHRSAGRTSRRLL